jgi:hypothetical protein
MRSVSEPDDHATLVVWPHLVLAVKVVDRRLCHLVGRSGLVSDTWAAMEKTRSDSRCGYSMASGVKQERSGSSERAGSLEGDLTNAHRWPLFPEGLIK